MAQAFERHTISFVLRLWVEPTQEQTDHCWRGQLEHVGSGERAYFQVPDAILTLLAVHLAEPGRAWAKNADPSSSSEEHESGERSLRPEQDRVRAVQGK